MDRRPSTAVTLFAGSIAGASETICTYPAEFVKTRRQLPSTRNLSTLAIIRSTLSTSCLKGLYSGCTALAVSNAAKSGIRFYSFDASHNYLSKAVPALQKSPLLNVYAGLCAGITESILVVTPGETVKTKMIHASAQNVGPKASIVNTIRQVIRSEGVLSLWRGLGPVLCKQGTNSAVRFATFGAFKDRLNSTSSLRNTIGSSGVTFLAGAGSGVVTVYASMPFDNIKTRMQSIGSMDRSMLTCARKMLLSEGVTVFWKATTPRLVRLTLSSSITFTVYDWVVRACRYAADGPIAKRTTIAV
ncbi:hypothetical protein BAUCODRAFT_147923 [Baudoinia panamericana UAMH 10762]|uniref:Mitochondrial carrier protein n=1 Tax=Baudoinia panamericana (strain UAMH 10762) TaxID=717646 RepID=M2MXK0_BAUPA|nr:uncharacterized protein BAUCODRAFT_147923 [Baudoinia panamericana UAMH 10762]EMC96293.1 hypothetical protein BAUCODRAFT_147923 [Baudoinia panamericana UAMH 10762]